MKILYDQLLIIRVFTASTAANIKNTAAFAITTLAPAGVSSEYEAYIPTKKQHIESIPEQIITVLKCLHKRIEERAGKIMSADINSVPIILIPITIVIAVSKAITVLYTPVLKPVAFEKLSSKVTAKILL